MPTPDLEAVTAAVQKAGLSTRMPREPKTSRAPGRSGTVPITVHVEPIIRKQLKVLSAEHGITVHRLVCEGLNAVFAKYQRPEIAR
jgi:hypothetical protein